MMLNYVRMPMLSNWNGRDLLVCVAIGKKIEEKEQVDDDDDDDAFWLLLLPLLIDWG